MPIPALEGTDLAIATALVGAPRASWRELAQRLALSERTVVRRAVPLYERGLLRATAVRNPGCFPELVAITLRLRCVRERIHAVADSLSHRPDTVAVDIVGGGSEITALMFLDGPQARDTLLMRDLPATAAVISWDSQRVLHIFPSAGDAGSDPTEPVLGYGQSAPAEPPPLTAVDHAIIETLIRDGRASYTELAQAAAITAHTARRRLEALLHNQVIRPVTVVDFPVLGLKSQALLWLSVQPSALDRIGRSLAAHPKVFFAGAVTGPANLLLAVAERTTDTLYAFINTTIGALPEITAMETCAILATTKRTGLPLTPPWALR
ncbi:Lrp/AsnC family transcriptional regulator [Nocardia sp. CDC159]|uniref:Lrp/AsnC family transcriptional regulator n=1 Tax=Nocardia pulmonis TaxID=2951408 RepID=A0A9X2EG52_9NOCA|nr:MULTISPECIES: AsnC family transcriptional regulator [Nocardia]MCM6778920.1 Lrp/AsnC family transcriptional regulator [Nocardia pulmonis]MCM6791827.1 Lrp/AsnC family transcriptional regulator [Nocardia sp. CDC159]